MAGRVIYIIFKCKKREHMLNRLQIKNFIETTIQINAFNLLEYQDKYYFQKKIQEELPLFSEKEIYQAIEKFLSNGNKDSVNKLSDELYNIYLAKGNDTSH